LQRQEYIPVDELPVAEQIEIGETTVSTENGDEKRGIFATNLYKPDRTVVSIAGKKGNSVKLNDLRKAAPPEVTKKATNAGQRERYRLRS